MRGVLQMSRGTLTGVAIGVAARRRFDRLMAASRDPAAAQDELLKSVLSANAETAFGREHGFSRIRTFDDFRAAVPVQSYDALSPYIERQESSGEPCLTAERPVYYHRTSGTVGKPKFIPVTASGLDRIKWHQRLSAFAQSKDSQILHGKIFAVTGQAVEGRMSGGTPFGSASGLLYEKQSALVRSRYVLPPSLSALEDYECRYFAMAAYGLSEPNVTGVATANPSTLVKLLSVIVSRSDELLEAIASGRPIADGAGGYLPGVSATRSRVRALEAALQESTDLSYNDIWPALKGIVTWTGGSCGVPLGRLKSSLPADCRIMELGYIASEVRGTVNVDVRRNCCLPMLMETVFEFVERDAWEAGGRDFLLLEELEPSREYYVFVTTRDGLYRYDMNDIVRVTGRVNGTPTLAFVQKGKGVTSITGEKLYEAQVLDAVLETATALGIRPAFFVMLADQEAAAYTLYLETDSFGAGLATEIAGDVDAALKSSNIEYAAKRDSGRLGPVAVKRLRQGTGDAYRSACVSYGQRDAQFKYLHLQYAHECRYRFENATVPQ